MPFIFSIIIITVCVTVLFLMGMNEKKAKKKTTNTAAGVSAQDFMNVRDIVGHVLYTVDGYCISYIRLQPPMSSLWSKREKRMKTNTIVAELSKDREPWMLTGVSRPMDITQLINQYKKLRDEADNPVRKKLLKQEIQELQNKVGDGEAMERQFYIKIWSEHKEGAEEELKERARQILKGYETIGITGQILGKPDIIRYCNLIHNPGYINTEDATADPSLPIIADEGVIE